MPIEQGGSVMVARTVAEVEQLRPFWSEQQTSRDGDLDFYLFIVGSRSEVVRPHVIVVNRDGGPRAMLIGRLEQKPIDIRLGYLRLPSPSLRILTFIDGGVLRHLSTADSELVIGQIMASLRAGEADAAVLEHCNVEHPLFRLAGSLPGQFCVDRAATAHVHWIRRLPEAKGSLLASLSANERNNQRRRAKRLAEDFREVRLDCFHDAAELDRLLGDVEAVARTSYQRGLGVGFINDAAMRGRLTLEAEKGTLRAHILYADGRPCAFWVASLHGGILYNDFMGFDPAYGKYAPGMYLVINVLEEVCRDPLAGPNPVVDFGIGAGEWKARLGNDNWQEASLAIFAPSIKSVSVNALRTLTATADRVARGMLARTSLLPSIKRLYRQGVAR
jgi:hypothetical protein